MFSIDRERRLRMCSWKRRPRRLESSLLVCLTLSVLSIATQVVSADIVEIAATQESSDPIERLLYSAATLLELQAAIDNDGQPYPDGTRTIELAPGLHDFSAVVIPREVLPDPVPPDLARLLGDHYTRGREDVYWFNPLDLPDLLEAGSNGHGIAVYGRENLTIRGAPFDPDEAPRTVVAGSTAIFDRGHALENPASAYNVAFTVANGSRNVTIERLTLREFMSDIMIMGAGDVPESVTVDAPFYGDGTEAVTIRDNRFEVDRIQGVVVGGGRHRNIAIRDNHFVTDATQPSPAGWLTLNVSVGRFTDLTITDNSFLNCLSCIRVFDAHYGTVIRNNEFVVRSTPEYAGRGIMQLASSHGLPPQFPPTRRGIIEGNRFSTTDSADAATRGRTAIMGHGAFDWRISGNEINGFPQYGIWLEGTAFPFVDGTVQQIPARGNVVTGNTVTNTGTAIQLGSYFREGTVSENEFAGNGRDVFIQGVSEMPAAAARALADAAGIEQFTLTLPRASGTRIVVDDLAQVEDASACSRGVNECVQADYDNDGTTGEDAVDGVDNDGDGLIDEDPVDQPNDIRVRLCHAESSESIVVPSAAARMHLEHGDEPGVCRA